MTGKNPKSAPVGRAKRITHMIICIMSFGFIFPRAFSDGDDRR